MGDPLIDAIFREQFRRIGELAGEPCNIIRPSYTATDQSGTSLGSMMVRIDTQAERFMKPPVPGVLGCDIYGNGAILQEGDVIAPTKTNGAAYTIVEKGVENATVAIMTDHICDIHQNFGTVIYSNLYFGWAGPTFPGSGLVDALEESFKVSKRKAILYKRQGIGLNPTIKKGDRLVEKGNDNVDGSTSHSFIWLIDDIITYNKVTLLSLRDGA